MKPGRKHNSSSDRQRKRLSAHVRLLEHTLIDSARSLLVKAKCLEPPYSPWLIASHLGVRVDELPGIEVEGYVEMRAGREQVVLNAESQFTRKTFTLAHELGHIQLFRMKREHGAVNLKRFRDGLPTTRSGADPREERLCNVFATELLMPLYDVEPAVKEADLEPRLLLRLSETFGVSLQAASLRCVDVLKHRQMIAGAWRLRPDPVLNWWYGVGRSQCLQDELSVVVRTGFHSPTTRTCRMQLRDGRIAIGIRHHNGILLVICTRQTHFVADVGIQLPLFGSEV